MTANATIYHNPRCSKSRQALEILRGKGIEPQIILYLETPPEKAAIAALLDSLGLDDPRALMRTKEETYKTLGLADPGKSREALINALAAHPELLERPVVITAKGARIARPPELLEEIL